MLCYSASSFPSYYHRVSIRRKLMKKHMDYGKMVAVTIVFTVFAMKGVIVLAEGNVECEKLPVEMCAFAVSSSGARCVLEKKYSLAATTHEASVEYQCQSSGIMSEKMKEWIENEDCVEVCGLQRMSVGMSTDDLSTYSHFTSKLCSHKCQNDCPNVVDLYLNLAAGEGIYLPHLCDAHKTRSRRMMYDTAAGPTVGGYKASSHAAAFAYSPY